MASGMVIGVPKSGCLSVWADMVVVVWLPGP